MIEIDLEEIAANHASHSRESIWWTETSKRFESSFKSELRGRGSDYTFSISFRVAGGGAIGPFNIPKLEMGGGVTSLSLFGLDELILMSFYAVNASNYSNVADLGANIGVHSLVMATLGYSVVAYEADPMTSRVALELLSSADLNGAVSWNERAVVPDSFRATETTFVRVLGNTTSSHVKGSKTPYGELEEFSVPTVKFGEILRRVDLVKLDVEGLEAGLFGSLDKSIANNFPDCVAEIGTRDNGKKVFDSCRRLGLNIFAQRMNWGRVEHSDFMPSSYREGSVFISRRDTMPWF